jgi:hypothetical protein
MSHRVTTETEIKDKSLAVQAIKQAGLSYREVSDTQLMITSGSMKNASIDLRTGDISGDTDYHHTPEVLGMLRQHYGEAKYKLECQRQGITIESRTVDREGNIVLMCAMS